MPSTKWSLTLPFDYVLAALAFVLLLLAIFAGEYHQDSVRAEFGYVDCSFDGMVSMCTGPACATAKATCAK